MGVSLYISGNSFFCSYRSICDLSLKFDTSACFSEDKVVNVFETYDFLFLIEDRTFLEEDGHHFPLYHRLHGTAYTTEYKCQLIVSCLIMLFSVIFSFIIFILFYIPHVQPSFSRCPQGTSWTHWAGVPPKISQTVTYYSHRTEDNLQKILGC